MIKVTGRFPIRNIQTMIREFKSRKNLKLSVDMIDHSLYDWLHLDWRGHSCRTIIYAVNSAFYYQHLYGRYAEIPRRFSSAEGLMRAVCLATRREEGVYCRFRHEPWLSGYAGSVNATWMTANNYDGALARLKSGIRQITRWCLPFLWL